MIISNNNLDMILSWKHRKQQMLFNICICTYISRKKKVASMEDKRKRIGRGIAINAF